MIVKLDLWNESQEAARQNQMNSKSERQYRELFEKRYGRRISDASWYRIKKNFNESDFQMTLANIHWLADLKKQIPHLNFRFVSVVRSVKEANKLLRDRTEVSGTELLDLFDKYNISVHANTLTKWFKPLKGFSRKRIYEAKDLSPVVLSAYLYKVRQDGNENFSLSLLGN